MMTESEKRTFYMANCNICLLAQNMKTCATCQFKTGLESQSRLAVSHLNRSQAKIETRCCGIKP